MLILRQDEDWTPLRNPAKRTDPLDRLKFVPLTADGSIWMSFAVDSFVSVRSLDNPNLGLGGGFDDTYNTRLDVDASLSIRDRLRLYASLKHGWRFDQRGPVPAAQRKRFDLHQAFVEAEIGDAVGLARKDVLIRVGRQELNYGDGRLIAARVGPNVRADFDGILARARTGRIVTDAFLFRGVTDRTGLFDNKPDHKASVWGIYSSLAGNVMNVDLTYLGQHRGVSPYWFAAALLSETRHTLGVRLWSSAKLDPWRFGLGANYQFGTARGAATGPLQIRAWAIAATAARKFEHSPWKPSAGIEVGVSSGDRDPNDRTLGTFRSLYPPGRFTGLADGFGPGNLIGVRPYVDLFPLKKLRLRPKVTAFWRLRASDGLYSIVPSVISSPAPGSRFAGIEPGFEAEWTINPHWTLSGFASNFFVGRGIGKSAVRRDVGYLEATLAFKL